MVSVNGRSESAPAPGSCRVVNVYSEALVRLGYEVVDALIPSVAARAELLGKIPQHIRCSLLPAECFVAPAKNAVALRRIKPHDGPTQPVISDIVWRV